MIFFAILIILFIKLIWCWFFLWNHPDFQVVVWDNIKDKCKTGDLILFHGLDNYNPIFIGCYYGHIGIIYRETPTSTPYLFEALNPTREKYNFPVEIHHGIALTDLKNRLSTYRGYVFYKPLAYPIPEYINMQFKDFIHWAINNMKYNTKVIQNGVKKLLLNDSLKINTNCGELVYMALINLELLHLNRFINNRKHHLNWLCNIHTLDNGNYYLKPMYVWQEYFKTVTVVMPNYIK